MEAERQGNVTRTVLFTKVGIITLGKLAIRSNAFMLGDKRRAIRFTGVKSFGQAKVFHAPT